MIELVSTIVVVSVMGMQLLVIRWLIRRRVNRAVAETLRAISKRSKIEKVVK